MFQSTNVPASSQAPWWESLEQYFEQMITRLGVTLQDIVQVISFFGVGFFAGFLLKKYMRYFFIVTLFMVGFFIVFDHFGVILINWNHVQQLTGIDPSSTVQQCGECIMMVIRQNLVLTLSGFLGFIIGYRVG